MVDINLIGDDKGGEEEERIDEFSQTSNMDAQEYEFEDQTETFDTTKSVDYSFKRRSNISTFIIFGAIILLGGAIYFLFFTGNKKSSQPPLSSIPKETEEIVETIPAETEESPKTPEIRTEPTTELSESEPKTSIPATSPESLEPVTSRIISTSRSAIGAVTDMMTMLPSNLSITLISYAGQRLRMEFVAPTETEAQNFITRLTQNASFGEFTVLSKSQVATNGRSLEKVLLSGSIPYNDMASVVGGAEVMNLEEAKAWFQQVTSQYGLKIKDFKSHQASYVERYQKIPLFVRIYGSKSALIAFMEEIAEKRLNVELTKILLLAAPEMVNYSDDNLYLVLNLYLYQAS